MENCIGVGRCLICRRATLENSPIDPENLPSNASLLLGFLYCFHVNELDSKVHDLSRTCQFCQTCEQFVAEWSSIQTQMTQLTRRAAQLKATLSTRGEARDRCPWESPAGPVPAGTGRACPLNCQNGRAAGGRLRARASHGRPFRI